MSGLRRGSIASEVHRLAWCFVPVKQIADMAVDRGVTLQELQKFVAAAYRGSEKRKRDR